MNVFFFFLSLILFIALDCIEQENWAAKGRISDGHRGGYVPFSSSSFSPPPPPPLRPSVEPRSIECHCGCVFSTPRTVPSRRLETNRITHHQEDDDGVDDRAAKQGAAE